MIDIPIRKKILIPLLITSLFTLAFIYYLYAHSSLPPAIVEPGSMVTEADYIIFTDGAGNYYARNGKTGKIEFSGTDATQVIQAAINALTNGGKIFIKAGSYSLSSPILIQRNGITLEGEGGFGDLFFTSDATYYGYSGKNSTLLFDNSTTGIDMIKIGFTDGLVFGTKIKNLALSGYSEPILGNDSLQKSGNAIYLRNAESTLIEDVSIYRKTKGIYIETVGSFEWDNVNDVLVLNNLQIAYCEKGIVNSGWLANVRISNLFGYINEYGLLELGPTYDLIIDKVWSNADGWNSSDIRDCPIYIGSRAQTFLRDITIYSTYGVRKGYTGLFIDNVDSRARTFIENILIQGVNGDAIRIDGENNTEVYISNIYIGINPGTEGVAGGDGGITGSIVHNYNPNIKVSVKNGYAYCDQAKEGWFVNVGVIDNISNYP